MGELNLLPAHFWTLTPGEYNVYRLGYYRRQRANLEREARWVVMLVNAMGRSQKRLRVEDIIGMSPERKEELVNERDRARAVRSRPPDPDE